MNREPRAVLLQPIGTVRNSITEQEALNASHFKRRESHIVLKKQYAKGLRGLEDYSHLFVLFWLHKVAKRNKVELITRPGHREHLPRVGVFSTRNARHRPNHLGLTVVKFLSRRSNVIRVRGLDAFDGSPVLDIKPYTHMDIAGKKGVTRKRKNGSMVLGFKGRITVSEWWSRF